MPSSKEYQEAEEVLSIRVVGEGHERWDKATKRWVMSTPSEEEVDRHNWGGKIDKMIPPALQERIIADSPLTDWDERWKKALFQDPPGGANTTRQHEPEQAVSPFVILGCR